MSLTDRSGTQERRARIELMIRQYRAAKQRRLMHVAMTVWRQSEADRRFVRLAAPPERVH